MLDVEIKIHNRYSHPAEKEEAKEIKCSGASVADRTWHPATPTKTPRMDFSLPLHCVPSPASEATRYNQPYHEAMTTLPLMGLTYF